ncbi:MAG: glutathione S-transferase N-terminal domain-containing protein [Myxococcota bacterium]
MSASSESAKWPIQHPDRLQLYTLGTPNGQKPVIALEELELPYELHKVNIMDGDQFLPEYVAINPNSKIPSLVDPDGPLKIMESAAILIHLGRKTGRLLGSGPTEENHTLQWLFFQVGHIGPMFGQFGHFYKFAKGKTDTYGEERYGKEVSRLLGVLDRQLDEREYLTGEFSMADIATVPWINALDFYEGKAAVKYDEFKNVHAWVERFMARPAVTRALEAVKFD